MKEAPVWTCSFEQAPGGETVNTLTVGSKFAMKCHGDIAVAWPEGNSYRVEFPKEEMAYSLAVLKAENVSTQEAQFLVTAYKPGKFEPDYIRVFNGDAGFEVAKPRWEIQSVIKQESGKPPQPYPPYGPFAVSLPFWIVIVAVAVAAVLIYAVMRQVRRSQQRRRMLDELKRHRTALSPLHQFYRDSRSLSRKLHNVKTDEELKGLSVDLDREFRLYVLRQFEIPALDWSDGEILRDLRRRHRRVFLRAADPLKKTLRELVRLRAQPQILVKDVEQLHRMSLDTVERLDQARVPGGRA